MSSHFVPASVRDLEWLIGSWQAKRDDVEVKTTYEWWGNKAFIRAEISITLAVLLAAVAVSVLLPSRRAVRAGIVLAVVIATLIWVFAEGFGMPFMGMATDPDTGPLLVAIAVAFWPITRSISAAASSAAEISHSPEGSAE